MNTSNFEWPVDKKPLYSLLSIRLRGLIDGILTRSQIWQMHRPFSVMRF